VTSEQWILRSHSQIPRHWKWEFSARVSQKFRQTYISHLINSCCLRWRILHSGVCPSVETHWSTATIYSLGFDRLTLPSLKDEGILELILIYRTWVSEFQTGSVRRILNCFFVTNVIQTNYAALMNHSSAWTLHCSGTLRIKLFLCAIQ